jgi:hypothetical protein
MEALSDLNKAVELDVKDVESSHQRGLLYYKLVIHSLTLYL